MSEFHMACEQLSPLIPRAREIAAVHAERLLQPTTRYEHVLVMPRFGGKTSIMRASPFAAREPLSLNGGWLDETSASSRPELRRTISGMLRVYRESREQFPNYRPKITLRPETWAELIASMPWVERHIVAHLAFPQEAFYSALREAGATPDALAQFNSKWLSMFCDAGGRLYPGLAFEALQRICLLAPSTPAVRTCRYQGAAEACAEFVLAQPDISYWVTFMVPDDLATLQGRVRFSIPIDRFLRRIRQARRKDPTRELPHGLSAPQFAEWGMHAGIWSRLSPRAYYAFAFPYSIGASFLKARLTDDAFRRMSKSV